MADESEATPETATDEPLAEGAEKKEEKKKIKQTVEIKDIGPCKKHIKVTVDRADIESSLSDKYKNLMGKSWIPGFRPGKAPKQIVTRKFKNEVFDEVKGEVLLSSLEQLAEEHDVAPLAPPNLNPASINIPEKGDFVYEFDVEVRPHFDLPNYKGLKLKKPTRKFEESDVDEEMKRLMSNDGQLIPKDGKAEKGDFVIVDMITTFG